VVASRDERPDAACAIDPARGAALLSEWKARGVAVLQTADVLREVG
jgi:hypothetical protein